MYLLVAMKFICLFILFLLSSNLVLADKYPSTTVESQMMRMGSILEKSPTITFAKDRVVYNHSKDQEKKSKQPSESLWVAIIEELSDFPIMHMDNSSYTIITDWLAIDKNDKIKVVLNIKSLDINDSGLTVKVFTQKLRSAFSTLDLKKSRELEDKILLRALKLSSYK